MRAISILMVITSHLGDNRAGFIYGAFGVEIFFVLSGFLITHLLCLEERQHGRISVAGFYRRRVYRILPPAFFYLLCIAVLTSPIDLLQCVLFVRNLGHGPDFTAHYWSLSIEEQFYLLWPAGFLLLKNNRSRSKVVCILIAIAPLWRRIAGRLAGGTAMINSWRFDLRYDALLIGCCLALLLNTPLRRHLLRWNRWSIFGAGLTLIVSGLSVLPGTISATVSYAGVALVILCAIQGSSLLDCRPLVWIGKISFSLYLWQQLFCMHSPLRLLGQFPVNVLCAFAMAMVSYYTIERFALHLRGRSGAAIVRSPVAVQS